MPVKRGIGILTVNTDARTRKLWFGTGGPAAAAWVGSGGPVGFASEPWVAEAESIRILGTAENAELIVSLYHQRLKNGRPSDIRIGSPNYCEDLSDPPTVFRSMMENELPASLGGWHLLNEADYRTYAVLDAYRKDKKISDRVWSLLEVHPAFPALSFIRTIDWDAAIEFLSVLVDPRFHVSPKHPDRNSKMKSFFGLAPGPGGNVHKFLEKNYDNGSQGDAKYSRAQVALGTWFNDVDTVLTATIIGPRNFLMRSVREFLMNLPNDRSHQDVVAVTRTSHIFLRFVREVWLDCLTPKRSYEKHMRVVRTSPRWKKKVSRMIPNAWYNPTLFVPEHFFKFSDEVNAWHAHNTQ